MAIVVQDILDLCEYWHCDIVDFNGVSLTSKDMPKEELYKLPVEYLWARGSIIKIGTWVNYEKSTGFTQDENGLWHEVDYMGEYINEDRVDKLNQAIINRDTKLWSELFGSDSISDDDEFDEDDPCLGTPNRIDFSLLERIKESKFIDKG